MNYGSARNHITSAALFFAALLFHPWLLAQGSVKVKTPGTEFSVVGTKGTTDDAAGGRRFRAGAFEELKIRGLLRVPQSASGVPKTQQMQQLTIHFRTSPSGPSLRSVELRNGSNVEFHIDTNLTGDYTTRETPRPDTVANVWSWNPPIKVGSQSLVVLGLRFPGGFDSKINPGDFVLTSVDAEFPREAITGKSAMTSKDAAIALGRDQSNKPSGGATVSATSIWPNGKAYFFNGSQYVRYDPKADKVDEGYPLPIAGRWPGFPPDFEAGVDAAVVWGNGKVYFFKGDQYLRYDIAADKVDQGYPLPIAGHWPGLWADNIDAGVVWPNGKAYFFKGSQYIRYDIATDKADPGYPSAIRGSWPGFPSSFAAGVDDAVVWNNGKAYFFKGSEYIRYDIATDKTDEGYPLPIAGHWTGLRE